MVPVSLPCAARIAVAALVLSGPPGPGGWDDTASIRRSSSATGATPAHAAHRGVLGGAHDAWVEREAYLMGTLLRLRVAGPDRPGALSASEAALEAVEELERRLSTWRSGTEMERANRAAVGRAVGLSAELSALLARAFRWSEATGRAFDPAVGALVDAWDLRGAGRRPSAEELDRALAATGPSGIRLDSGAGTLTRLDSAAWVDPGGFGKGAALARAAEALGERGVKRALLDFGGQLLALGSETGEEEGWPVEVAHPSDRVKRVVALRIQDASVATTGTSERFVEVDGHRVGHVLDPRTGLPVAPWGSVTVVARDPVAADALSTALYVLGADAALRWARERPGLGVLVLEDEGSGEVRARWSPGMERWLVGTLAPAGGSSGGG